MKKKRIVYFVQGMSPSGQGRFSLIISKKDIGFYKVSGYKVVKKVF